MQTTINYNFISDTDGWVATPGEVRNIMVWYPPHKGRSAQKFPGMRPDPILSELGGCIRTTARNSCPASENYWELTKTWEELGVPAGNTVTEVTADYQYRYMLYTKNAYPSNLSEAVWGTNETGVGPFELRDSAGTLIDTISDREYCKARTVGDQWAAYPIGTNPETITEHPSGWKQVVGTPVTINHTSDTQVKLRLRNLLPATSYDYDFYIRTRKWIRLKQDRIEVTITYEVPLVTHGVVRGGTIKHATLK